MGGWSTPLVVVTMSVGKKGKNMHAVYAPDLKFKTPEKDYAECKLCGDRIPLNTDYLLIECECGALSVDGGSSYVRVLGDKEKVTFG